MLYKDICYVDENFETSQGNIFVIDGKISQISKESPEAYSGRIYDGRNKIMLPGFFNIHSHVPMVLLRGHGEGLPLDRWLNEKCFPFEAKLDADGIYWGAMLGMAEMIRSGTVAFTEMYYYIDTLAKAVDETGLKANIGNGVISFSDAKYIETKEFRETEALRAYIKTLGHDRIKCDASVHAEYTSNPKIVTEVAEYAKSNGMRMHVHLSETKSEHEGSKERRNGLTPTAYFAKCGIFDVPATAAHCVFVEDSDIEILREKDVTVSHNPSSNLKLGSGIAPIWKMHKAGVRIGIGTDGASSNNNLNMLEEVNLASILQKGVNRDPMCMDMASTLRMAALNGAQSQGRTDCGQIKVGNAADLIIIDLNKQHLQPAVDPLANVLYAAEASDVCLTVVDGKILYENGEFLTIDIEKTIAECNRVQKKVLSQL